MYWVSLGDFGELVVSCSVPRLEIVAVSITVLSNKRSIWILQLTLITSQGLIVLQGYLSAFVGPKCVISPTNQQVRSASIVALLLLLASYNSLIVVAVDCFYSYFGVLISEKRIIHEDLKMNNKIEVIKVY